MAPLVKLIGLLLLFSTFNSQLSTWAQGTAFTYQGQLSDGGNPANGTYDLAFGLFSVSSGSGAVGGTLSRPAIPVSNGVFTVTLDFGANFPGADRWLEISVHTNGSVGGFTVLSPRQKLTPAPYAIAAGNLTGTVGNGQLANSSITVNAGTGLGGGGAVALGGATTLSNVGVLSVTGNSDITANSVNGAVTLGDTATSADVPSAIVKRDATGNFSTATITLDNNLNLPTTTATAGIIYSGNTTLLHTFGPASASFYAGLGAGNLTNTGSFNTGIGFLVLAAGTSGFSDTAVGANALQNNADGIANTAIGSAALEKNTNGGYNVAIGDTALFQNTSGSYNVAIGEQALFNNTTGQESTAVGNSALTANTSGTANTAVGSAALFENTTGFHNTAVGLSALEFNVNGDDNTAVGAGAIGNNIIGSGNSALGEDALDSLTNGNNNTAAGFLALGSVTSGNGNVGVGAGACPALSTGSDNVGVGLGVLPALSIGSGNVAIGQNASPNISSGTGNIAIGANAGGSIVTGNNNIEIGNPGVQDESGVIRIGTTGTHTKAVFNGIFGTTVGSPATVVVNANGLLGTVSSSRRFKQNIQNMANASDVLLALHPVTFQYKPDLDPDGTPQFGLIAEDVEKVDPDLVLRDNKHQIYTVRYEAVNAMLLNEFLKQHETVQAQKSEIEDLKQRLDKLEQLVNQGTVSK